MSLQQCPCCEGSGQVEGAMAIARAEFEVEKRRVEVEHVKDGLRAKKPLFPWRIKIERI